MGTSQQPGPIGVTKSRENVRDGTLARRASPLPGPFGAQWTDLRDPFAHPMRPSGPVPVPYPNMAQASEAPLAWGNAPGVSAEFRQRVREIAGRMKINPNWLMACIAFESGESFNPAKRNAAGSGAVGLIQFMPDTAVALGTTPEKLAAMTAVKQLDYVEKYFKQFKKQFSSLADVYMAILWPAAIGKTDDATLFDKDDSKHPKRYAQNARLDKDQKGKVTKADAAAKVAGKLQKGLLAPNVEGPSAQRIMP